MTKPTTNDTVARDTATPIWISRRTCQLLAIAALAVVAMLLARAPTFIALLVGGGALALVLSFPVRRLSRVMPRGAAIALSLLLAVALVALALGIAVPKVFEQLAAFAAAMPGIAQRLDVRLPAELEGRLLSGLGRFVSGAAGVVGTLIGVAFVAVYLLADARNIQAAILGATPHRYRRDVQELSDAFTHTLSRYLGGLVAAVLTEGALAAIAFHFLGINYALLFGAWVSLMALIPYIGAVVGYAPAVLFAFAVSPQRGLLVAGISLRPAGRSGARATTPRLPHGRRRRRAVRSVRDRLRNARARGAARAVRLLPGQDSGGGRRPGDASSRRRNHSATDEEPVRKRLAPTAFLASSRHENGDGRT